MASRGEDSFSYLSVLPPEIVLQVMASLTVQERYNLIKAYPQYRHLGQDHSLKTRSIKRSHIPMTRSNLQWLLDPNGTAIEFSLEMSALTSAVCSTLHLMPNLEEVTLKNCNLSKAICLGHKEPKFAHSGKMLNKMLGKIKVLNFDSCTICPSKDPIWCWSIYLIDEHIDKMHSNKCQTESVTFRNMVTVELLLPLLRRVFQNLMFNEYRNALENLSIEVESLDGESLNLARHIWKDSSMSFYAFYPVLCRLIGCMNAVNSALGQKWHDDGEVSKRKLAKLEIRRSNGSHFPEIKLTDDFDMEKLKRDIENVRVF